MRTWIILLLAVLLLAGCQPTPEEEIVMNKADGTLEEAIRHSDPVHSYAPEKTAEPEKPEEPTDPASSLRNVLGVPEQWTDAYDGSIYGGMLYVRIDAATEVPNVSRVPVFAGRLDGARAEETERLTKLLLGDGPYYRLEWDMKAEALEQVKLWQAILDAIDAGLYGDAANVREQYAYLVEAWMKEYQKAEEPAALEPWDGSYSDKPFQLMNADRNAFQWVRYYLRYTEHGMMKLVADPRYVHAPANEAEQAAAKASEQFVQTLGLCDAKTIGVYPIDGQTRMNLHTDRGFDDVCFTELAPVYAGIPIYQYSEKYHGSYYGAVESGYMEEEYAEASEQETIHIIVRDGRVVQCMWFQPFHVTETVNENVALLPFATIADIFRKNIFLSIFAGEDVGDTLFLHVTDVKLSYMRIKQKDSDAYYLLPVWDFLGYATKTENEQLSDEALWEFSSQTLLTINAIDGSVIDRTFGY